MEGSVCIADAASAAETFWNFRGILRAIICTVYRGFRDPERQLSNCGLASVGDIRRALEQDGEAASEAQVSSDMLGVLCHVY